MGVLIDKHGEVHLYGLLGSTIALLVALVASCAPDAPDDTHFGPQEVGLADQDAGLTDLGEVQAAVLPTLDGTWIVMEELSTCVEFLVINEQLSWFYYIVESTQGEDGLVDESWRACAVEGSPIFGFETVVPRRLLDIVFPIETHHGVLTGTIVGQSYVSGLLVMIWGVQFEDPLSDPFPESGDDPRIVDTDNDGNPGASIHIGPTCQAYQVERKLTVFPGVFTAPDRIEGPVICRLHTMSIGSSQPLCGVEYETWPNDERTHFVRIRADGQGGSLDLDADQDGEITCEEMLPYIDLLFERQEPDHRLCELDS